MYAADNLSAYGVFAHRHTGELLEQIGVSDEEIIFTPHLLPIPRGILSTIYVRFKKAQTRKSVARVYREFFAGSPMVRLYEKALPQIQYSVRTNYADIGFQLDAGGKRAIIISCLDNLLKGAAGQAVQNLNVIEGWPESEGLL
jgi:N-acetyl-gamma-glutamyl-phosphate reductase